MDKNFEENKNRKIFNVSIISSVVIVLFYIAIVVISAIAFGEGCTFGIIMVLSTIIFITSLFIIYKYAVEAGYHVCKHCNHKFVPTFKKALLSPHIVYTLYIRCPECGNKSWAKKVMSK